MSPASHDRKFQVFARLSGTLLLFLLYPFGCTTVKQYIISCNSSGPSPQWEIAVHQEF
jgi:hypothetical protein